MSNVTRRNLMMAAGIVGVLVAGSSAAQASIAPCFAQTEELAAAGEKVKTWSDLHAFYERYQGCENGYMGEQLSNMVSSMLSTQWDDLQTAVHFMHADKSFGRFILAHVDKTVNGDTLRQIVYHAQNSCPEGLTKVCAEIQRAGEMALKDADQ